MLHVDGFFLGDAGSRGELAAWKAGGEPQFLRVVRPARAAQTSDGRREDIGVLDRDQPLPDSVNVEFEDGLTCETATCLSFGERLLLIPPLGTPPLRSEEGQPGELDDGGCSCDVVDPNQPTGFGLDCQRGAKSRSCE
ncbi:MAG TPA: hypothetical protein VFS67_15905 [Polyangiaceae bacterium]|nr:hypothetical protein [Polyangiaceae bacterium]